MENDKLQAAQLLVEKGLEPNLVAASLQLPLKDVQTLYASRTEVRTELTEPDKELAEGMRVLVWKAFERAIYTLEFGHPKDREALIRLILQRSMGLIGAETTQRFDEMKGDFERLVSDMTTIPEESRAAIGPPPVDSDDPDEGFDD